MMTVSRAVLFSGMAVSAFVLAILGRRFIMLIPLYRYGDVRTDMALVIRELRDEYGIATSFFSIDRLHCTDLVCELTLKEQWNLTTVHHPRERIVVKWHRYAGDTSDFIYEVQLP